MKIRIKNPIYGVPITFLGSYNPKQFEIIDLHARYAVLDAFKMNIYIYNQRDIVGSDAAQATSINGKPKYARILIRKK